MKISNINISKNNSDYHNVCHAKSNKSDNIQTQTDLKKIPLQTYQAMAFKGTQKDWIFLENVNIPQLGLNANLYRLKNGQKVLLSNKEGPTIIKTFFKVGSMNEPDNLRGISHYIEHNLFNGSKNFKAGEFVKNVNKQGAKYNASTGFATTDYFIVSSINNKEQTKDFIKLHADMLVSPLYSEDMLEKEKGPVISEIQMLADNPDNLAINNSLKNLFQIKTTSSDLIGGSVENIKNLTREQVVDYYKNFYSPNNAITVIIGEIDEQEVLNNLNNEFKDFKNIDTKAKYNEPLNPIQTSKRVDLISNNAQSNIINLAFAGPKNNEDKLATKLLLSVLSGYKNAKLNKALKKYNIEPSIGFEYISNVPNNPGAIYISANTPKNNTEDILKTIYETIYSLSVEPVSDNELFVAKEKFKNSFILTKESNMDIAGILGTTYTLENNFNSLKNIEAKLNNITPKDIQNAAKKFLDLNKTALTIVHPKQNSVSFGGKPKTLGDMQIFRTPNNAVIHSLNTDNSAACTLRFDIQSKNHSDTIMNAILGKVLSKGTSIMKEDDFNNIEDTNNIEKEFSSTHKGLKLFYLFPHDKSQIVMNNFKNNFLLPNFSPENFEKTKNELKTQYMAIPKQASHRLQEEIFKNSQKGISIRKICENLDKISYNDFVNYYNNFIKDISCKITLCGDLNRNKDIINSVYQNISNLNMNFDRDISNPEFHFEEIPNNKIITETQERNQADIIQGFRIKESGNVKDKAAILVLNEILGGNSNSRLFNDLREKQKLAYRVHSNYSEEDKDGILTMRIFTTTENSPENLQKSINGFKYHIKNLIENKVSEEELNAAKLQIKSRILFETESTAGKNMLINSSMDSLYKENYLKEFFNALDNITPQTVQKAAQIYLTKPSVTSIIASKKTIDENKEYINSLGKTNYIEG